MMGPCAPLGLKKPRRRIVPTVAAGVFSGGLTPATRSIGNDAAIRSRTGNAEPDQCGPGTEEEPERPGVVVLLTLSGSDRHVPHRGTRRASQSQRPAMRRYAIPATLIVLVATVLVLINEYTSLTFVRDYAWLLITAAMLVGVFLSRRSTQSDVGSDRRR